ncbi:MAG: GNAT family N-acetyltransferase [Bacillota bacterium]
MIIKELEKVKYLDAGISLWNQNYNNYSLKAGLYRQNILAPFSGLQVRLFGSFADNRLVGFGVIKQPVRELINYVGPERGWISLLVTEDGAGSDKWLELLDFIINQFRTSGVKYISYGQDPQNFLPGLPAEFEAEKKAWVRAGFRAGGLESDLRRVYRQKPEAREFPDDSYSVQQAKSKDRNKLLNFLTEEFPGRWQYEAENISRWPGGLNDYYLLIKGDTDIIGFARTNRQDGFYKGPNLNFGGKSGEAYAGLGPLGLAESWRGKSLSTPFLQRVLNILYHDGYKEITIDWTTLIEYYQKFGYEVVHQYIPLQKELM